MKYVVVQDLKSETKVTGGVFLFDFFFLIGYAAITFVLGNIVHESLRVAFYIFSGCCAFFLTMKSTWNKKRRNWESLFLFLRRDKEVYYPIINGEDGNADKSKEEI